MTEITNNFLLVDDDMLNNFLTKRVLKKTFGEVQIHDFTIPEEGLEFIKSETVTHAINGKTTLFLDINMPSISGWEFLKAFDLLESSVKEKYNIFILSSSVNLTDKALAKENPLVIDFLEKPLSKEILARIFV